MVGVQTKEIYDPNLGHLGPILAQNRVFGHLLDFGSFDLPDFAYCDSWQRYVATIGGQGADKKYFRAQIWAI